LSCIQVWNRSWLISFLVDDFIKFIMGLLAGVDFLYGIIVVIVN
jgi:hypothetical protein